MILVVLGVLTGVLIAATGVGGGTLLTPLLVLMTPLLVLTGVPLGVVVGTDLVAASGTKLAAVVRHGQARQVEWTTVRGLALGSLPAAFLAGRLHVKLEVLVHLLALVLLFAGTAQLALRPELRAPNWLAACPLPVVGVIVGSLVGLTSVGSGALIALYLRWSRPHMPFARLAGTDVMHGLLLTAVAAAAHASRAAVNWHLALLVLAGSVPAAWLSAAVVPKLGPGVTRALLGAVLIASGGLLLFR